MRRTAFFLLLAMVAATTPALSARARESEKAPIITEARDPEVAAAVAEARKTLPQFWTKFEAMPTGYSHFAVKVGLKSGHGGEEHIWMNVVSRANGKVAGDLANEPYDLGDLKIDSRVEVAEAAISDWQYAKGGKLYGHFTSRAMLAEANDAQRAQAAELFSDQPLEVVAN